MCKIKPDRSKLKFWTILLSRNEYCSNFDVPMMIYVTTFGLFLSGFVIICLKTKELELRDKRALARLELTNP